jgi:phosphate transport system protein
MMKIPKRFAARSASRSSRYIERIADHATNVAEMVVYLVEGKIIAHDDLKCQNGDARGLPVDT